MELALYLSRIERMKIETYALDMKPGERFFITGVLDLIADLARNVQLKGVNDDSGPND